MGNGKGGGGRMGRDEDRSPALREALMTQQVQETPVGQVSGIPWTHYPRTGPPQRYRWV